MHGLAIQTGTSLSINARPFSVLLLTLWLLAFTTGFLFTTLICLVSWNCNYSVSGFSVELIFLYWNPYRTPVWFLGIMTVLCTLVAVLCGVTWHVSLAGHHNLGVESLTLSCIGALGCPVGRCEGHRVVWRALLLCNLYNDMRAFMCLCILYMCTCVGRLSVFLYVCV